MIISGTDAANAPLTGAVLISSILHRTDCNISHAVTAHGATCYGYTVNSPWRLWLPEVIPCLSRRWLGLVRR